MKVLITGAAGFLGARLARRLLEHGTVAGADGRPRAFDRLVLADVVPPVGIVDDRVQVVTGDIADARVIDTLIEADTASIFHLAAVVSGMAEADFELGMRVNVDASRRLIDACRALSHRPRFVFASSVAVYGGDLPDVVLDTTPLRPQSSYGMEKAVVEFFITDATRRGAIDGRVLRLPTISVRPGRPNAAASSFASGIIREPLNGENAVCPVEPHTRLWLSSPATVIEALVHGHDVASDDIGANRAINLPGLSVSVAEMTSALERVAGREVTARIRWERDARIERIVSTWPGAWDTTRARALGFPQDEDMDAVIRQYIKGR